MPSGNSPRFLLDQERRDPTVPLLFVGRGPGEEDDVVGLIGKRAPHLRAVDDPATVIGTGGLAPNVRHIGTSLGLGQGKRTEVFTGGDLRQHSGFLLGREAAAHPIATRQQSTDAHPRSGEFFGDEAVLEDAESQARRILRG